MVVGMVINVVWEIHLGDGTWGLGSGDRNIQKV
jgi:hypothetical protein